MCGILGVYGESLNEKLVEKSLDILKRRGPDGFCKYKDGDFSTMIHTRLSIINPYESANQPMKSYSGENILIFNGEIYNYKELAEEFLDKNLVQEGDSRVLIELWEKLGLECLDLLNGIFAFSIYNKSTKEVFTIRDRFGVKPLYFFQSKTKLLVCSDIKPILIIKNNSEPNLNKIASYLYDSIYDNNEETFFKDIYSLKAGYYLRYKINKNYKEINRWYDLKNSIEKVDYGNKLDIKNKLDSLLNSSIKFNTVSDVDIGVSASGGVDSAYLTRKVMSNKKFKRIYNQDYSCYSEREYINNYIEKDKVNYISLDQKRCLNWLKDTVTSQSQPFGGIMVLGYNELYKKAKEDGIKVLLDGNGLDEILLGYEKYLILNNKSNEFPNVDVNYSIDGTKNTCFRACTENIKELIHRDNTRISNNYDIRGIAIDDLLSKKVPRTLRFTDHQSMYHGVEVRVPYLDHRLVEFACSIKTDYLLNKNGTKVLFRDLLYENTKSYKLAYSRKRSVQNPQREWFSKELGQLLIEIINSKSFIARGWIEPKIALSIANKFKDKVPSNSNFLWQWMSLELWARAFLDNSEILTEKEICILNSIKI